MTQLGDPWLVGRMRPCVQLADTDGVELKRHEGSRAEGAPARRPHRIHAPHGRVLRLQHVVLSRGSLSSAYSLAGSTKYTALQAYRDMAAKMILLAASQQFVAGKCRVAGLA